MDEKLKISKRGKVNQVEGGFTAFTGISGDYFLSFVPSLNISGYGVTSIESMNDLEYNIKVFFNDILELPEHHVTEMLKELGWSKSFNRNRQFRNKPPRRSSIAEQFDNPYAVTEAYMQPA